MNNKQDKIKEILNTPMQECPSRVWNAIESTITTPKRVKHWYYWQTAVVIFSFILAVVWGYVYVKKQRAFRTEVEQYVAQELAFFEETSMTDDNGIASLPMDEFLINGGL